MIFIVDLNRDLNRFI